jgi:hypothetical protein
MNRIQELILKFNKLVAIHLIFQEIKRNTIFENNFNFYGSNL